MDRHLRGGAIGGCLHRVLEPHILFPLIATIVLAVIWGTTLAYQRVQTAAAARAAEDSTREILETYEAQVVRALDQINLALNVVSYWHSLPGPRRPLRELRDHELLPPDLLFIVSVADREGRIIDTTRRGGPGSIAGRDYFEVQREPGFDVFVGQPRPDAGGDSRINFSRRLTTPEGEFDGVVVVVVDAAYFASGYEPAKLGERGLLALLGSDGHVRVRRSGERLEVDGRVDYSALISADDGFESPVVQQRQDWDGELRWLGVRPVYGFPLAVMAGLSVSEQSAAAALATRRYLWAASIGSVIAILVLGILGRQSWQLALSRRREAEIRKAHAERIEHLAYHDPLTGLPNRSLFSRLLAHEVSEAVRYQRKLAVAFIDLDRFKSINDNLGHDAGDELLRQVATRLRANVRESDTVARLGGDEFVVVLPNINGPADAAAVARKILSAMQVPFHLAGRDMRVTTSIGISLCPQHGTDEQTLKKHADIAMYEAKADGRNKFRFFTSDLGATTLIEFQRLMVG